MTALPPNADDSSRLGVSIRNSSDSVGIAASRRSAERATLPSAPEFFEPRSNAQESATNDPLTKTPCRSAARAPRTRFLAAIGFWGIFRVAIATLVPKRISTDLAAIAGRLGG